jgi:tetratricopeptide (TPR) repeat protein
VEVEVIASFVPRLHCRVWPAAALAISLMLAGTAQAVEEGANQSTDVAGLRAQETQLRAGLSKDPEDAPTRLKLGRVYIALGNFPAATEQARAAQRSAAYRDDADALLSSALLRENQFLVLLRDVKPGDRKPQVESEVRTSLGIAMLDTRRIDEAASLLQDAVRLNPASGLAHVGLARVLILLRKLPEARKHIEAAQLISPKQVLITRIAAELDRASGDATEAIAKFNEVLRASPTNVRALAGRAAAWISLDKLSDAQNDINAVLALRLPRTNPNVTFLGALILARQEKFAEAHRLLEKAQRVFDRMPIGLYLQGVLNYELGYLEIANTSLSNFYAVQPNASGAALLRAAIALRRKDSAAAIRVLEPFVTISPTDHLAVTMLAQAYVRNGRLEQAINMYDKLSTTPPVAPKVDATRLMMIYGDAYGDLTEVDKIIMRKAPDTVVSMAALRDGDVSKAAKMAEELAMTRPDDARVQNLLGAVRIAQQRLPEAEAIFRGLLEKQPDFSMAAFGLAQVLMAEKRPHEAIELLIDFAKRKGDEDLL